MKVRFNRKKLIGALKESRAGALKQFKLDTATFHKKNSVVSEKVIANTEKYLAALKSGEIPEQYRVGDRLFKGVEVPSKPRQPRFDAIDRIVQQLELSEDETILCDTKEDYVQLTSVCSVLGSCKA
jgi:hypothetical protein